MTVWRWNGNSKAWRIGWVGPEWQPAGNYIGALHVGPFSVALYRGAV
jgi:hypothetical protein